MSALFYIIYKLNLIKQKVAITLIMNIKVKINGLSDIPKWNLHLLKLEMKVFLRRYELINSLTAHDIRSGVLPSLLLLSAAICIIYVVKNISEQYNN